jgi:hypothetical protein
MQTVRYDIFFKEGAQIRKYMVKERNKSTMTNNVTNFLCKLSSVPRKSVCYQMPL